MNEPERKCEIEDVAPYHCNVHGAPTVCCEALRSQKNELKTKMINYIGGYKSRICKCDWKQDEECDHCIILKCAKNQIEEM